MATLVFSALGTLVGGPLGGAIGALVGHQIDGAIIGRGMREGPRLKELPAPVILTGAMTPLGFEGSDGLQNLTESLLAVKLMPPGIYIAMHNQVFPIDHVRKNRELARFVWVD